VHDGSQRCFC